MTTCPSTGNLIEWLSSTSNASRKRSGTRQPYSCAEDLVLDRGMVFQASPLSTTQLAIVLAAVRRARGLSTDFDLPRCFTNAASLVLADRLGELCYVEGYAMGTALPVHHAWATIGGRVVDLTWRRRESSIVLEHDLADRILGVFGPTKAYVGIPFPKDQVFDRFHDANVAVPFLLDEQWLSRKMGSARRSTSRKGTAEASHER